MPILEPEQQPPFAHFMGMRMTQVTPECVRAELLVREELGNRNGVLHGGALMALADNLGGTATIANLKDGQTTTTIESKTNFFAAIPVGSVAKAECAAAASRAHHDGLADQSDPRGWKACRNHHANAARARSEMIASSVDDHHRHRADTIPRIASMSSAR
jgi:uncharacterized protein (TIGR00369 family)